jgi:sulfite exporter TauE/SafE
MPGVSHWLLIACGGLLGSSHCVGMCGGFVLALGQREPRLGANFRRQLVYALGRVSTYTLGGAFAGFGGWQLARAAAPLVNAQALLLLLAGALVFLQGLATTDLWPKRPQSHGPSSCPGARPFGALLRSPKLPTVFVGGLANGLIPCGLVYAYLALAVSTGNLFLGMATMAAFGLGTMPVMILTGCGTSLLSLASRRRLFQAAAWAVVLTGALTVYRGADLLVHNGLFPEPGCPACSS